MGTVQKIEVSEPSRAHSVNQAGADAIERWLLQCSFDAFTTTSRLSVTACLTAATVLNSLAPASARTLCTLFFTLLSAVKGGLFFSNRDTLVDLYFNIVLGTEGVFDWTGHRNRKTSLHLISQIHHYKRRTIKQLPPADDKILINFQSQTTGNVEAQ